MLFLLACTAPPTTSVLWISLDTTRADDLARAATPNLDALAARSIVYERLYTTFPETGLSHWAMLTGVLPEVHGNVPATGTSRVTSPTAAEIAKAHGYATAAFVGGVTMQASATGLDRGFDTYDDTFSFDRHDMKRDGDEVVARARAWLDGREGPWFAFVHLFDAHFPYTPDDPRRYDPDYSGLVDGTEAALDRYRDGHEPIAPEDLAHARALYDAELTELDAALAPLLAGVPDDTIVVVTADHGESFEHGYLFNHRGSLFDGVLHVPWILRVPGRAAARVDAVVSNVDVLPTVAAAAGWEMGATNGRSVLDDPTNGRVWARTDPWSPTPLAGGLTAPLLALRTHAWKVLWAGDGTVRGYDLAADPGEEHPLEPPAELIAARADYDAALAAMAVRQGPEPALRALGAREGEMLEALGYADPRGPQGPPPGAPGGPQGPPPGAPDGPRGPPGEHPPPPP